MRFSPGMACYQILAPKPTISMLNPGISEFLRVRHFVDRKIAKTTHVLDRSGAIVDLIFDCFGTMIDLDVDCLEL